MVDAEFGKPLSLKAACELKAFEKFNLPRKSDYTPSGEVSVREIEEGRQNVRCMAALLNAAMREFDLHPITRPAATVFSPASFVKGYFDAMGLIPPSEKFDVPNEILGYAMESFSAGRAETKIRHVEVPVAPLDFMSEYPTVAALMDLMEILRAKKLTFEDATNEAQSLIESTSLHRCFKHFGERAIVETFEGLLHRYFYHPESKSLGPDGEPCQQKTRGRLRRPYVIGGKHHRIGKEVDRRWEEGDDLDAMRQSPIEYTRRASRAREPLIQPSLSLGRTIRKLGIRRLIRQGFGRRIIEKISRRELVKASTYREYERRIEEYARRRQRPKHSL